MSRRPVQSLSYDEMQHVGTSAFLLESFADAAQAMQEQPELHLRFMQSVTAVMATD